MKTHEVNYATHDLELTVVVMALKMWRHFLIGCLFEMKYNHKIVEYIFTKKDLNARQRRWSDLLNESDFKISYIKGKENKVEDSLSRRPHINAISAIQINLYDKICEQLCNDQWYIQI